MLCFWYRWNLCGGAAEVAEASMMAMVTVEMIRRMFRSRKKGMAGLSLSYPAVPSFTTVGRETDEVVILEHTATV